MLKFHGIITMSSSSDIVTLALKRQFFYINICCFIITDLSGQD